MTTMDVSHHNVPIRRSRKETKTGGIQFPRYFTTEGVDVYDTVRVGLPRRGRSRTRRARSSSSRVTSRCRSSGRRWRPTSSSRSTSAGTSGRSDRETSVRQLIGRVVRTMTRMGARGRLLRHGGRRRCIPRRADPHPPLSDGVVQLARLVQRRHRADARSARPASSTPSRTRWTRSSASRRPRGCCSSTARERDRTSRRSARRRELLAGGGTASGPGLLHEGLRLVRRRHQVGRQDPPRREDGHPQRRPSRHRRLRRTARPRKRRRRGR